MSKLSDKEIEKNRYNKLASEKIYSSEKISKNFGKDSVKETLRDPYTFYEESIQKKDFFLQNPVLSLDQEREDSQGSCLIRVQISLV